jgi:hypothetical protein
LAVTCPTGFVSLPLDGFRNTAGRFFQRQFYVSPNVSAAPGARSSFPAKEISEHPAAKDLAKRCENVLGRGEMTSGPLDTLMSETVISRALFRIAKDFVRLGR